MKKFLALLFVLVLSASALAADSPAKLKTTSQLKTERLGAQRGSVGQFIAEDLLGDKKGELLITYEI